MYLFKVNPYPSLKLHCPEYIIAASREAAFDKYFKNNGFSESAFKEYISLVPIAPMSEVPVCW